MAELGKNTPRPTEIKLHQKSRVLDRVGADRLDVRDLDVLLPDLQDLLAGPWPRTSADGE